MSESMTMRARLAAPVKDVYQALTDAAALRTWLAEYAEVDLPHRYRFWGRYTPEGEAPRQRPLYIDDHTLRFSWLLDGEDTTVEIGLEAEGAVGDGAVGDDAPSTVLTLSQTHFPAWDDMVAEIGVRSVLHTFWSLAIANLSDYLAGRELTPRCDFTSAQQRAQVLIGASREAVYRSLVDPQVFRRWFGANVDIELYVGGRFAMGGFDLDETPAKIIELEPGRKITMSWEGAAGEGAAWEGTVASWELADSGGKTRLTFVQSGFDQRRPPYGAWMGWLSGIAELRRFHELPGWRSTWLAVDMPGIPDGILATE